jgi:S-adenosylmethionine synthetase
MREAGAGTRLESQVRFFRFKGILMYFYSVTATCIDNDDDECWNRGNKGWGYAHSYRDMYR